MMRSSTVLARARKLCLSLPDTEETITWGKPHFRVAGKIFCGFGEESGRTVLGFKLAKPHAALIVSRPTFWPAPYVGRHGWVSMDASGVDHWDEVRDLLLESYQLIAPKASLAKLAAGDSPRAARRRKS